MQSHTCPRCEFIYLDEQELGEEGLPDHCPECGYTWPAARLAASLLGSHAIPEPMPVPPVRNDRSSDGWGAWRRGLLVGLALAVASGGLATQIGNWTMVGSPSAQDATPSIRALQVELQQLRARDGELTAALGRAVAERDAALGEQTALARTRDELEVRVQSWESLHAESLAILRATQRERDALRNEIEALTSELADLLSQGGDTFIRRWQILGPLPLELDRQVSDAIERDPFAPQFRAQGVKSEVVWRPLVSEEDRISLNRVLDFHDKAVCYLETWVYAAEPQRAQLSIGSDDGCCIWLNRDKVLDRRGQLRSASPGQDRVPVSLQGGWNELLVLVDNAGGSEWGLYAEFRSEDGSQPMRVRVSPTLPRRRPGSDAPSGT